MSDDDKKSIDSKPANLFGDMLGNSNLVDKDDDKEITDNPESKQNDSDPMELKNFSIRMPVAYKEKLSKHFKEKSGMNMSNGLRDVLYSYMRDQGLIK